MQDRFSEKIPSPTNPRVEDGRIRKMKTAYKSDVIPIQHFNGKTYACESCKRGHRVHKCDHGKTRPISETNQPGRPSGGQKRGCKCPRNCACTTKSCKCERDCACTQEMFVIVRVDGPQTITREATPTPKPVWEDANGQKMTLKKVWADANGKEIGDEEYQERTRRMKEREEGTISTPEVVSSCCGTVKVEEPDTTQDVSGGCRHRQNIKPEPEGVTLEPARQKVGIAGESWKSACSCGSGCSCLYCPDHPNNATSINHTQRQVKNLAEQAYTGGEGLMPVSFMPETTSRSCMGGRPTFFLSRTPDVSQQQLEQFFPENLDANAIYLTYPISQHSWTNQPVSAHCSHVQSPSGIMAMTPDASETYVDSLSELSNPSIPWEFLPNDSNGTWDFSSGQVGDTSFSWTDFDASRGTDYSVGQATVASMSNTSNFPIPQGSTGQHTPMINLNMDPNLELPILDNNAFIDSTAPFDPQSAFVNFDHPGDYSQNMSIAMDGPQRTSFTGQNLNAIAAGSVEPFAISQPEPGLGQLRDLPSGATSWNGYNMVTDGQMDLQMRGASIPSPPPIASRV